jgi:hypothetical protein
MFCLSYRGQIFFFWAAPKKKIGCCNNLCNKATDVKECNRKQAMPAIFLTVKFFFVNRTKKSISPFLEKLGISLYLFILGFLVGGGISKTIQALNMS